MKRSIFLVYVCVTSPLAALFDTAEDIRVVRVKSVSQTIVDEHRGTLEGDVEIWIDRQAHLWADHIDFDRNAKTLHARSNESAAVSLETHDFLLLANNIFLDIESNTGCATTVRAHVDGKYLFAQHARKKSNGDWIFDNVTYSACEHPHPHWQFYAKRARLRGGVITLIGITLRIGGVPIFFLPRAVFPSPRRSSGERVTQTGFLVPKFYLGNLGFGVRQEFYWDIAPGFDSTVGINWKRRKGFILYDEFRHAKSANEHTHVMSQYVSERNAHRREGASIVQTKHERYLMTGEHFHTIKLKSHDVNNLVLFEVGSDRKAGYEFLDKTDAVEDTFDNSVTSRFHRGEGTVHVAVSAHKLFRERFIFAPGNKHEQEEKFVRVRAPHVQWDTLTFHPFSWLSYRHTLFSDVISSRYRSMVKEYTGSAITGVRDRVPLQKAAAARVWYEGVLFKDITRGGHTVHVEFNPNIQLRTHVCMQEHQLIGNNALEVHAFSSGRMRLTSSLRSEWSLPRYHVHYGDAAFSLHPVIAWNYTPRFTQDHWYESDMWDRVFARNECSALLRLDAMWGDFSYGVMLREGYDWYNQRDWLPQRRTPLQNHVTPFTFGGYIGGDTYHISWHNEYDIRAMTLVKSSIDGLIKTGGIQLGCSIMYQDPRLLEKRELLADIPSFGKVHATFPLGSGLHGGYSGHFYSRGNSWLGVLENPRALYHRVALDYHGHCYRLSLGFEEKRYRQQGDTKSERSYFFLLKLNSLGSFAHRFKREPAIIPAPQ